MKKIKDWKIREEKN